MHQNPPESEGEPDTQLPAHERCRRWVYSRPLRKETAAFALVSSLDVITTTLLLRNGGVETNPIANFFLRIGGIDAMVFLKLVSVVVVVGVSQVLANQSVTQARRLLICGTLFVMIVVLYSIALLTHVLGGG